MKDEKKDTKPHLLHPSAFILHPLILRGATGLGDAAADLVGCCVLPGSLLLVGLGWWVWENWRFARLRRRRDLADAGICWKCGYDLRASTDRCPECGTRIDGGAGRDGTKA